MKEYSFSDLAPEIESALKKLDKEGYFGQNTTLTILNGFVYLSIQNSIGNSFNVGNRILPIVVVTDNSTGRIWQFSLKHLVPRVELS